MKIIREGRVERDELCLNDGSSVLTLEGVTDRRRTTCSLKSRATLRRNATPDRATSSSTPLHQSQTQRKLANSILAVNAGRTDWGTPGSVILSLV